MHPVNYKTHSIEQTLLKNFVGNIISGVAINTMRTNNKRIRELTGNELKEHIKNECLVMIAKSTSSSNEKMLAQAAILLYFSKLDGSKLLNNPVRKIKRRKTKKVT